MINQMGGIDIYIWLFQQEHQKSVPNAFLPSKNGRYLTLQKSRDDI